MSQNIAQKIDQKVAETIGSESKDSDLIVRLADSEREVDAAQALRYRVFYENMGAQPSAEARNLERDLDAFDPICDHLLIIDRSAGAGALKVVGITLMFGCASFPGTKLDDMAHALSMLHHNHRASDAWRPVARSASNHSSRVMRSRIFSRVGPSPP